MAKSKSSKSSSATIGFEQQIWDAACELWGHIPAADYRKIFTGLISFVGIAVPHITRSLLKSAKPAYVIPAAFFCGAVFCVFCDLIARTVFAPTELAIGTVTSIFGAPVVIYMMVKRRRNQEV